jgi:flavin reductase (DIM6/NTAB) family NADH-FMN oxidoreductase RutF
LRKATYSYGSIVAREAFTVSVPSEEYFKEADYFGIASGRDSAKFEVAELTPVRSDLVDAPFVGEFPLVLECKLLHTLEIGLHTLFVGEILDVKAEEALLDERGRIVVADLKPFWFAPDSRAYYGLGPFLGEAFSVGRTE